VTVRELPVATTLAGVNMRMKPGGIRELHWHKAAEWGYMLAGRARLTAVDPLIILSPARGMLNTTIARVGGQPVSLAFITGDLNNLAQHLALAVRFGVAFWRSMEAATRTPRSAGPPGRSKPLPALFPQLR
jgi:hypothetical protein